MVRPVSYKPTTAFKLSDAEIAKYKKIAADAKGKSDAKKSAAGIADALAAIAAFENEAPDPNADNIGKNAILLDTATLTEGNIDVDVSDITFEEPRVVAEDEEEAEEDERSLYGDGVPEPNAPADE